MLPEGMVKSHPFDRAGRQVAQDSGRVGRQVAFATLCPELMAKSGVLDEPSVQHEPFAYRRLQKRSHHSMQLIGSCEFQHRPPVVVVVEHDPLDSPL